ncbi:MAG TPA: metallophosphoesterase [bacterium]|nr:metallophosphoesterase [bacterium]
MAQYAFVIGDVHGQHGKAVQLCSDAASATGLRPDTILQVGDFNPALTQADVESVPAPARYRRLGDFSVWGHRYPAELIHIGGNHEPVRMLEPIWSGGEVASGVRFLGRAGVLERCGLRIGGLSGNYRARDYDQPLPVLSPDNSNRKGLLHIRKSDVDKLLAEPPVDILLMHDWPRRIAEASGLLFGRNNGECGYQEGDAIIDALNPRIVLLGHMHWFRDFMVDGMRCISMGAVCDEAVPANERCVILRIDDVGGVELVRW